MRKAAQEPEVVLKEQTTLAAEESTPHREPYISGKVLVGRKQKAEPATQVSATPTAERTAAEEGAKSLADASQEQVTSAEQVLRKLSDIADGEPYCETDKDGVELRCRPPLTARLKALELLGKHYELFDGTEADTTHTALQVNIRVVDP